MNKSQKLINEIESIQHNKVNYDKQAKQELKKLNQTILKAHSFKPKNDSELRDVKSCYCAAKGVKSPIAKEFPSIAVKSEQFEKMISELKLQGWEVQTKIHRNPRGDCRKFWYFVKESDDWHGEPDYILGFKAYYGEIGIMSVCDFMYLTRSKAMEVNIEYDTILVYHKLGMIPSNEINMAMKWKYNPPD